jgi:hypothetical protein
MGPALICQRRICMAALTIERIALVQADITEAVVKTSESSTLSAHEQDNLLAQGCAEACDLLRDLLDAPWWDPQRSSHDGLVTDVVPAPEEFTKFLGPMFTEALIQAGRHGMHIEPADVAEARAKLAATTRRHPRMKRKDLFAEAKHRVTGLQAEVCALAEHLKRTAHGDSTLSAADAAKRRRARTVLGRVGKLLGPIALALAGAMLGVGPQQMSQSVSAWSHEATRVIMVHYIADRAQPNMRISPPRVGPRLH